MKSNKQRRAELKARHEARAAKAEAKVRALKVREGVGVNVDNLAPHNSYGRPDFVRRGYYIDKNFTCKACRVEQVWTARQQKWWYEVAKGGVLTDARLCRACRRKAREHRAEARRIHLEGLERKQSRDTR